MSQLDEKLEVVDGVEYRYSTDWIHELESEEHWRLYWRQQHIMEGLVQSGDHVLEIGVGTGFTANYLRSKGVAVTTLDIDADKKPDIVANVVQYEIPERYDAVLAFEVFEHIPYREFLSVLERLTASTRKHIFMSVPRNTKLAFSFSLKLPKFKPRSFQWKIKQGRIDESHHYWECDHGGVSTDSLEQDFTARGLHVARREEAFQRLFYALSCRPSDNREGIDGP